MPTYEYKCTECGERLEVFQQMTDDPLETCPECSGKLKRLIGSGAGIIFKGSGFYCTDYRSESYKADARTASSPGKSDDSGNGRSKSDSAPSTKGGDSGSKAKETADV